MAAQPVDENNAETLFNRPIRCIEFISNEYILSYDGRLPRGQNLESDRRTGLTWRGGIVRIAINRRRRRFWRTAKELEHSVMNKVSPTRALRTTH
jgi:hypothetical protein